MISLTGLLALSLCVLPSLSQRPSDVEADWTEIWNAVEEWRTAGALGEPTRARELAVGRGDSLRSALLSALIGGQNTARALEREIEILSPADPWPLDARESWFAAEVLGPGGIRTRSVVEAMARTPGEWTSEQLALAHRLGVEAAEDLRLEDAIAIQEPLHERARAEWSAFNLALSLRRAGLYQRADRVLAEQLDRSVSADLFAQRGLNSLGSGNESRARTQFGAALARGSTDAAVILARLDLAGGKAEAARTGFRALLVEEEPNAWALRGWGLALLPSGRPAAPLDPPGSVP